MTDEQSDDSGMDAAEPLMPYTWASVLDDSGGDPTPYLGDFKDPGVRAVAERVRAHLLDQGRQATKKSLCRYRIKEASGRILRCAIGGQIPDHAYDERMEGSTVAGLSVEGTRWNSSNGGSDTCSAFYYLAKALNEAGIPATPQMKRALDVLQHVHDRATPSVWPIFFERLGITG